MEAAARMKEEGVCDLPERLAAAGEFGLSKEEIDALLEPERYIGRCPEQVEEFLAAVRPKIAGAGPADAEITV